MTVVLECLAWVLVMSRNVGIRGVGLPGDE